MRTVRILSVTLITLLLLFLTLSQVTPVKMYLFDKISEKVYRESGWQLTVDEIDLLLPFELKLRGLKMEKSGEMEVEAPNAIIRLDAGSLFKGYWSFHSIVVDRLKVTEGEKRDSAPPSPAAAPLKTVPLSFEVRRLILRHVQLPGAPPFNFEGSLSTDAYNQTGYLEAALTPAEKGAPAAALRLAANWQKGEISMEATLDKEEAKGGWFEQMHILASGRLKGPIESWGALFGGAAGASPPLAGRLETRFTGGELHGALRLDPQTQQLALQNLEGTIKGSTVTGSLLLDRELKLIASLRSPLLKIDDYPLHNLDATLNARVEAEQVAGSFSASVVEDEQMLHSSGELSWDRKENLRLTNFILNLPEAEVMGSLDARLPDGPYLGSLSGKFHDLSFLAQILGEKGGGSAEFSAKLTEGGEGEQNIAIVLEAGSLKWRGHSAEELQINTSVTDIYGKPKGRFLLAAKNGIFNGILFSSAEVKTELEKRAELWPFTFHFETETDALFGEGGWFADKKSASVALDSMRGNIDKYPFRLVEPARFEIASGAVKLSPLLFSIGKGSLYASFEYKKRQLHTTARLTEFPLELLPLKEYAPPIEGTASGDAYLYGTREKLLGHLNLNLEKVTIQEPIFKSVPPIDGTASLQLKEGLVEIAGNLSGAGEMPIRVSASLPARVMLAPPLLSIDRERPLSLDLQAEGPVAPVLELFFPDTLNLQGQSRLNLQVTGTAKEPKIEGGIEISDGFVESYALGTTLSNLRASLKGDGSTLKLESLSAGDGASGSLSATGEMSLSAENRYPYNFRLLIDNGRLVNLDNVASTVSGELLLKGDRDSAFIGGRIANGETVITVPEKIPELSSSIDVIYVNLPSGVPPPTPARYRPALTLPVSLDLQVEVPGKFHINDVDLASEWRGEVQIKGTTEEPELLGNLKSVRGNYLLNGRQFALTEGQITFAGNPEKKTTIYAVASRDINDIIVEIVLKGKARNPDILLRSNPPLSQQEILSLILFGRAPSDISTDQGEILEQSLENLSDSSSKPGTLSKIQKSFGIDTIEVGRDIYADDPDEISVQIGKYLTPNLFISINRSFADESVNKIAIEMRLRRSLKLQLEAGDNSEGQVSLKWRHDY